MKYYFCIINFSFLFGHQVIAVVSSSEFYFVAASEGSSAARASPPPPSQGKQTKVPYSEKTSHEQSNTF